MADQFYPTMFSCRAKHYGISCTKPITTKQQSVFWSVSQSRHMLAIFVGSCRCPSHVAASGDSVTHACFYKHSHMRIGHLAKRWKVSIETLQFILQPGHVSDDQPRWHKSQNGRSQYSLWHISNRGQPGFISQVVLDNLAQPSSECVVRLKAEKLLY